MAEWKKETLIVTVETEVNMTIELSMITENQELIMIIEIQELNMITIETPELIMRVET